MAELQGYKYYLIRKGLRLSTVTQHVTALEYIEKRIHSLEPSEIERFLFGMYESGHVGSGLNNYVRAVRGYGVFLKDKSYEQVKYFKEVETTKGILSDSEITRFLSLTPKEVRVYDKQKFVLFTLFFKILTFSGLRPLELSTMRLQQCDLGRRVFILDSTTKTSKGRTVSIHDALVSDLEQHIRTLSSDNLFDIKDRHEWKRQFNLRMKHMGLKRDKISTYSLRHSWITRLLDEDANPHVMASMAGHSLEQQSHYYKLTTKSKRVAIQKDTLGRKELSRTERLLQGRKVLEDNGFIVFNSEDKNGKFHFTVTSE